MIVWSLHVNVVLYRVGTQCIRLRRGFNTKSYSRFDSLSDNKPGNRFASKKRNQKKFYKNREDNQNNNVSPNIGKFTQVGTGEVSFTPQYKCNTVKQKKKKEKLKEIKKDDINEVEINNDADIALTLALAEKYQYFTESEEEKSEEDEIVNSTDNSAW